MKESIAYLVAAIIVVGCAWISAWLVIEDHPWFALLCLLLGGSVTINSNES